MNGEYQDDSNIGKLMHDFSCWNPDDMNFDVLKDATRYYKENQEGVEIMCRAFEETRKVAQERERIHNIQALMETLKLTAQQAMDALKIPSSDQRAKYIEMLNNAHV